MSQAARTPAIAQYQEAFEALRPVLRGPTERRKAAFDRFAELGFPGPREEAWKYTSLRRLESRRFAAATREAATAAQVPAPPALGSHRVTLVDGYLRPDLTSALPDGIELADLPAGSGDDPAATRVLRVATGGGTERFAALNAALSAEPACIDVRAGARVEPVLHVLLQATGAAPTMSHPRLLIRSGAGSLARIVLHHAGDDASECLVNSCIDVELADGAELHLYRLQAAGARSFHIERIDAAVGPGARLYLRDSQLGAALARLDVNLSLDGPAAAAEATGLFVADGNRHLDTHLRTDHRAVGTHSLQDYRGVAAGKGRAVFNGKAVVHAGAQQSNARQSSRNLLLTPGAEIDTKPELEIYADDVQCSHGATTGQLDPAAMFYLRSRGLSENEARSALTRAFAGAVLSRVDLPALATLLHDALDDRISRLLGATT